MEWLLINWYYVGGALLTIGTGVYKMLKWFHKILIKNPIENLKEELDSQNDNYNLKFDETHEKIDDLKIEVSEVNYNTGQIEGKLDGLIINLTKGASK